MNDKIKQIIEQIGFCKELMNRLGGSFSENIDMKMSRFRIRNTSQMSNDIIRLRRELNTLNKMIYPFYN